MIVAAAGPPLNLGQANVLALLGPLLFAPTPVRLRPAGSLRSLALMTIAAVLIGIVVGIAIGGAGLVFVEMTCPTPDARITPGCPGLWNEEQRDGLKRIVDFVHGNSDAKIAIQLGHAGAKGSTRVPWEGEDLPLEVGNWPLISASPQQYIDGVSDWSRAMTRDDMDRVRDDFVRSTRYAVEAGFDWLELPDWENSVLAYLRKGKRPGDEVVVAFNFPPCLREDYRIGVPHGGGYRELFNSDAALYGGSNAGNGGYLESIPEHHAGRPFHLKLTLPPLATLILKPQHGG